MLILYASVYLGSMHFILHFMGLNARVDSVVVASSSSVGGLGTLQAKGHNLFCRRAVTEPA